VPPIAKTWSAALLAAAVILCPAAAARAAGAIVVASKIDTEGALLGNMIADMLEARAQRRGGQSSLGKQDLRRCRQEQRETGVEGATRNLVALPGEEGGRTRVILAWPAARQERGLRGGYTSGKNYTFSETNRLISNLKKKPSLAGTAQYHYKTMAIQYCGRVFGEGINPAWLAVGTLVPVPPSKARSDPEYDDRTPSNPAVA